MVHEQRNNNQKTTEVESFHLTLMTYDISNVG